MRYRETKILIMMISMVLMHSNMLSMIRSYHIDFGQHEDEFRALCHLYKITRTIFNTHKIEKEGVLNDFLVPNPEYRTTQGLILHVDNNCPSLSFVVTPWGLLELYRINDTVTHYIHKIQPLHNNNEILSKEEWQSLVEESNQIRILEHKKSTLIASELIKKCSFGQFSAKNITTNFDIVYKDNINLDTFYKQGINTRILQPIIDANYTLHYLDKAWLPKAIRVIANTKSSSKVQSRVKQLEEQKIINEWEALKGQDRLRLNGRFISY